MTETLGLTAERCVELLDARELSCRELVAAYLDRIDAADEGIHAFLRTRRAAALEQADRFDRDGRSGLQGVPIALKDILCTKGEETTAGSRILEGYIPIYDGGCVTRVNAAGLISLGKTNMDEFAMGSSTENSAFGVTHNPWDAESRARRLVRRLGRGGRRGLRAARARDRHGRLDPAAGGALRRRRDEADLRRGQPLRPDRLRIVARPDRPVRAHRARLRAAHAGHLRPGRLRRDVGRAAGADRGACGREPRRYPPRCALRSACPGGRTGCASRIRRHAARRRGTGRTRGRNDASARGIRPARLLPDRPGRGVGQPVALRRRPLRPALRGAGRHRGRHVRPHPRGRVRGRGQAPDHARHLRPLGGVLRRLLRHGPEGANPHPHRLRRGIRGGRPGRDADVAHRCLPHRRARRRPVGDVCLRRAHGAGEPGRAARNLDPVRPQRGPPGRIPAGRAGVRREPHPRGRARARAACWHSIPGLRRCSHERRRPGSP